MLLQPPTCISPNTPISLDNNLCAINKFTGAWMNPQRELSCYGCNPFGFHFNDRIQDGCYKWQFKIQCNEANKYFVENQWQAGQDCDGTLGITCHSITGRTYRLKEGKNNCGGLYRGYDIQGSWL